MQRKIQYKDVEVALELFNGDKKRAAAHLNLPLNRFIAFFNKQPMFRALWSKEAQDARQRCRTGDVMQAEQFVAEGFVKMNAATSVLRRHIEKIDKRLTDGERARFSDKPEDKKYAFICDPSGRPVEEEMLRDQLGKAIEKLMQCTVAFSNGVWTHTKTKSLLAKIRGGAPSGGQRAKPGFASKGERVRGEAVTNLNISADQVAVNVANGAGSLG